MPSTTSVIPATIKIITAIYSFSSGAQIKTAANAKDMRSRRTDKILGMYLAFILFLSVYQNPNASEISPITLYFAKNFSRKLFSRIFSEKVAG